jgi:hypothetical protein
MGSSINFAILLFIRLFKRNLFVLDVDYGVRGSVVVKSLCYKPEGHGVETRWGEILILPAALDTGAYSASNRNQYQQQTINVSGTHFC